MTPERAGRRYFGIDAEAFARRLLGAHLVRVMDDGAVIRLRITETEAYVGVEDRASHAFGGRRTARTEPMYAAAGTSYVYFTYGMHHCFNIVCGREGEPPAVLIRGGVIVDGLDAALANRGWTHEQHAARPHALADGPAKLCRALAIDRTLNAIDLTTDGRLYVSRGDSGRIDDGRVVRTARIGVGYAGEWATRPLRFLLGSGQSTRGNVTVKLGKPVADSVGNVARTRRKGA